MIRPAPIALGVVASLGLLAAPEPRSSPVPLAFDDPSPAEINARCEACHPGPAEQWRGSLHHRSFTDPDFQRSFAREPLSFCRDCHAPHGDTEAGAALGIGCVTCHLRDGEVLAAPGPSAGEAPHAVVRTAAFADARACASCHEFAFPPSRLRPSGTLMQSTVTEHVASPYAELSCADCHMARTEQGAFDHSFAISRDPERLRAAIWAEASRPSPSVLRLHLAPVEVGHAFPTGDLNRRLVLEAEAVDALGRPRARARRELARHFPPPEFVGARVVSPEPTPDDRLTGPTTLDLDLPNASPTDRVRWRVVYERVDHREPRDPEASTLFERTELAHGEL